jgi:hypothetical protein
MIHKFLIGELLGEFSLTGETMKKITTAEELQSELRTLWAMTEGENPSREKLASALQDVAGRLTGAPVTGAQEIQLSRRPGSTDWAKICGEAEKFRDSLAAALKVKVTVTITITSTTITITITIEW